jgi:putative MATE family efflux protein
MKDRTLDNEEKLGRSLARVALPIAAQSLIGSSLNLLDNLMVGKLGSGAEIAISAVGLGAQVYFIFWMVVFGFVSGTTTFMAQFYGKRDIGNIRNVLGIAITVTSIVGVLFFVSSLAFPDKIISIFTNNETIREIGASYIRIGAPCFLFIAISVPFSASLKATQQVKLPFIASTVAFACNTLLNYTFIYGNFGAPRMEVDGAALATSISRAVELAMILYFVFGRKNMVAGKIRDYFSWKKSMLVRVIKNSIPTTINETAWGGGVAMYNAAYGRIPIEAAFAAVQAAGTIQNLFILACFSLGDALLILVGEKLGKGELDKAYTLAKQILRIGVVIGLIAGGVLIALSPLFVRLYDFSELGIRYTMIILVIYACTLFIKVFNGSVITGVLRAGGDTRFAMFAETGCVWLIGVPMAFIGALILKLPVYYVVLMVQAEEIVKAVINFYRLRSKKWVRNLVKNL